MWQPCSPTESHDRDDSHANSWMLAARHKPEASDACKQLVLAPISMVTFISATEAWQNSKRSSGQRTVTSPRQTFSQVPTITCHWQTVLGDDDTVKQVSKAFYLAFMLKYWQNLHSQLRKELDIIVQNNHKAIIAFWSTDWSLQRFMTELTDTATLPAWFPNTGS